MHFYDYPPTLYKGSFFVTTLDFLIRSEMRYKRKVDVDNILRHIMSIVDLTKDISHTNLFPPHPPRRPGKERGPESVAGGTGVVSHVFQPAFTVVLYATF